MARAMEMEISIMKGRDPTENYHMEMEMAMAVAMAVVMAMTMLTRRCLLLRTYDDYYYYSDISRKQPF